MSERRVWAPKAASVDLVVGEQRIAMHAGPRGWFAVALSTGDLWADYGYSLDGGAVLPDPRSPRQPHGPRGRSRPVDHAAFRWSDQDWRGGPPLAASVLYELHIGTFTPEGTFDGAIERLEHLVELGVTTIEVMPVATFPGSRGWGYDGVDLYAPHEAYGGPDGLKRLVDAGHAHGLGVVLDVVYNHLGPDGNVLGEFGPYFTDRYRTPWGAAMNLDGPQSDEVRSFLVDNAVMWLRDYHLDGLRLDAVHALHDESAHHVLAELAECVGALRGQLGRHTVLIAESDANDPRTVTAPDAGGLGLDAVWLDDFHHSLHAVLTGERVGYYEDFGPFAMVAEALTHGFVYRGQYSEFRQRRHGAPIHPSRAGADRFVGYLQNHDQVGNRAGGERIGHLAGRAELLAGLAIVLSAPFTPMLFQGEEWSASTPFLYFTDHDNPELARAVSEGRRHEFPHLGSAAVPDPQDTETFRRSKLRWEEMATSPHNEIYGWVRSLLALRREQPSLRTPVLNQVRVALNESERQLLVQRGCVLLVVNLGTGEAPTPEGGSPLLSSPAVGATPAGVVTFRRAAPDSSLESLGDGSATIEASNPMAPTIISTTRRPGAQYRWRLDVSVLGLSRGAATARPRSRQGGAGGRPRPAA
jgi:maltooligosyltrehalose trehalohydrolase